ncbi:MAG: rhomboid family intramembrane serine protease [bacterium]
MIFPYLDDNPSRKFPLFTIGLIGINVGIFFKTWNRELLDPVVQSFGFVPAEVLLKPYTLVTSTFLHAGVIHLLSNMWFLWLFGDNIEESLGRLYFLLLYLTAGIGGNILHTILSGFSSSTPLIGASGSVAGIMGSYFIRYPFARLRCLVILFFYPIVVRIYSFWFLGFWMIFEFFQGLVPTVGDHVAHWAHIGGFLIGMVWSSSRRRHLRQSYWW